MKTYFSRVRLGARLIFFGIMLMNAGCVGLVPVPSLSNKVVAGQQIKSAQAQFIEEGKTTVSEVVDRFGDNYRPNPRVPAIAYSWEKPGGQGIWWVAGAYGGMGGEFEWSRWRALFLSYDHRNIVVRKEFVRLSGGKSLDVQLEKWSAKSAPTDARSANRQLIAAKK